MVNLSDCPISSLFKPSGLVCWNYRQKGRAKGSQGTGLGEVSVCTWRDGFRMDRSVGVCTGLVLRGPGREGVLSSGLPLLNSILC